MPQPQLFPATRWTLILASRNSSAERRSALEELLATYWKPLYVYARHCGFSDTDAQDAVQGLCTRLLEREFLRDLDPERGRLRSYLRTAMRNYLHNEHERAHAAKRGGGALVFSIDEDTDKSILTTSGSTPEAAYDRAWALTAFRKALDRLEAEYRSSRQKTPFEVVARFFDPAQEPPSISETATSLSISGGQLRVALHRARARFRTLLLEEAADTVETSTSAEDEVGELLRSLQQ